MSKMSVSLQDIAEKANVSKATVSRVLNIKDDPHISEATKQRVLRIAADLNYRPNVMARALVTGKTNTVGVWTAHLHPSFYSNVIMQMQEVLQCSGYEALIVDTKNRPELHDFTKAGLHCWPVEGILSFENPQFLDEAIRSGIINVPAVSLGVFATETVDSVTLDVRQASREAVEYLIRSGRKRIAFMIPESFGRTGDARYEAYCDVMADAGLSTQIISTRVLGSGTERKLAFQLMKEYVFKDGCPEAIFCINDEIAIGCHRALRDLSIAIPDDVAIIGCDGVEDTQYVDPPLSTIEHPVEEMCTVAWEFLQNRINNPNLPVQHAVLQSKFVIRGSS